MPEEFDIDVTSDWINDLTADRIFEPDVFDKIFKTGSAVERSELISKLELKARELSVSKQFQRVLKAHQDEFIQSVKQQGGITGVPELSNIPDEYKKLLKDYRCGDYIVDNTGVYKSVLKDNDFVLFRICSQPLLVVERLHNIQMETERVCIAYMTEGKWDTLTVDREIISNNTKIVRLANNGVDITTDTAKDIVRFLQNLMRSNDIPICNTVNHMGWYGKEFIPYSDKVKCDTITEFAAIYNSLHSGGKYDVWLKHCAKLRKNIYMRLVMAAAFSAPLVELIGGLPFMVHIWGGSEAGKTVALHVAASVWGKSKGGLVRTLNGTDYGINETAAFLYSLPCILDELQTIRGGKQSLNQLIMRLCEGMNRTQGKADGGIKRLKQWRNCFICSGEENIIKANSGGGTVNRVISLEVKDKVIPDGNHTMSIISQNYGHAGKMFIDALKNEKNLQNKYRAVFKALQADTDATDKQCMAMACLVLADTLAVKYIFKDETSLTVNDIKSFMATKEDVDIAARCHKWLLDWIAQNYNRFANSNNNGEVWGKIDNGYVLINKTVLTDAMNDAGYDYGAVIRAFADRGYIEKDTQGRNAHYTKVQGIKAAYVKLCNNLDFEDIEDDNSPFPP